MKMPGAISLTGSAFCCACESVDAPSVAHAPAPSIAHATRMGARWIIIRSPARHEILYLSDGPGLADVCVATGNAKYRKAVFCCALQLTSIAFRCFRLQSDLGSLNFPEIGGRRFQSRH